MSKRDAGDRPANVLYDWEVPAIYTEQRIPRFQGNRLIEALPRALSDEKIFETLCHAPDYSEEQRQWEPHERLQQLKTLAKFMLPMAHHVELARSLDTMIREGYVSRRPRDKDFVERLRAIAQAQSDGLGFRTSAETSSTLDTASLLGDSGMGKSQTLKRWLAQYQQVIHHTGPDFDFHQVTYIHVDMVSSGDSVKSLCVAVVIELDRLLPSFRYAELYLKNVGRVGPLAFVAIVARLLHVHHVGILVIDEVQKLAANSKKAKETMGHLLSLCNMVNTPILFVGTTLASSLLTGDIAHSRRAIGPEWNRLPRYDDLAQGDAASDQLSSQWEDFITVLWQYQWTDEHAPLTPSMLELFYDLTQGVIDLAIKLFALSQARAILRGHAAITEDLVNDVYEDNFKGLHLLLEAMRNNDIVTLERLGEARATNLASLLDSMKAKVRAETMRKKFATPKHSSFVPQVATALMATGFDEERAVAMAQEIQSSGKARDTVDAMKEAADKVKPKRNPTQAAKREKATKPGSPVEPVWPDLSQRPKDYRRATRLAWESGATEYEALEELGMAPDVELFFALG